MFNTFNNYNYLYYNYVGTSNFNAKDAFSSSVTIIIGVSKYFMYQTVIVAIDH